MPSFHEIQLAKQEHFNRLLGHFCTAFIAVMVVVIFLTACKKIEAEHDYKLRGEVTRCQEGYTAACQSINRLGGVQ